MKEKKGSRDLAQREEGLGRPGTLLHISPGSLWNWGRFTMAPGGSVYSCGGGYFGDLRKGKLDGIFRVPACRERKPTPPSNLSCTFLSEKVYIALSFQKKVYLAFLQLGT